MGFFTKYGDGACDLTPLSGPDQAPGPRGRRRLGASRGAHRQGADRRPGGPTTRASRTSGLGVTYEEIDDFLEGRRSTRRPRKIIATHAVPPTSV